MSTPVKRKFTDTPDDGTSQQKQEKKLKQDGTPSAVETPIEEKKRLIKERIAKSKQQLENIISVDTVNPITAKTTTTTSPPITESNETTTATTTTKNEEPETNLFYDPRIKVSTDKRKKLNSFTFTQPGRFSKKADKIRSQALADEMKKQVELNSKMIKKVESLETYISVEQVPDIEWWDKDILIESLQQQITDATTTPTSTEGTTESTTDTPTTDKEKEESLNKITKILNTGNEEMIKSILNTEYWGYVEHPVQFKTMIQSKYSTPPPLRPDFLMLSKDRKKMRKQRRAELLREKQERQMNGMEAPPEDKVKLSNIMRVLGTQAILDPTKALMEVQRKIQERKDEAERFNNEKKLTPEQRKEKSRDKKLLDAQQDLQCSIYKVLDLSHPLHRSIIGKNSNENLGTGCIVFHPSNNLIVFEGGKKAQKIFKKLLLNRIDWENPPPIKVKDESETTTITNEDGTTTTTTNTKNNYHHRQNNDLYPKPPPGTVNSCHLVWTGPIHKAQFKGFQYEISPLESQARKYLQDHSVPHFWDMIKNFEA